jgi:CheY-like chemotaxis protein
VHLPILAHSPKPTASRPDAQRKTPKRRRILVVDDNRDSAESLAKILELAGNETHTAYDGLEAAEAAAALRPDLVLLDLGMPKLNGYEAARKIRERPWGRDILLVAVTGWGQDEDRQKSKAAGFDAHLVKPVNRGALATLLAELDTWQASRRSVRRAAGSGSSADRGTRRSAHTRAYREVVRELQSKR